MKVEMVMVMVMVMMVVVVVVVVVKRGKDERAMMKMLSARMRERRIGRGAQMNLLGYERVDCGRVTMTMIEVVQTN